MIESRVIEHVGDQVVDLLHVIAHRAQLQVQAFVDFAFEHGDGEPDARQRRAHLVRQGSGHFLLALDELADARRHVIEVARQAPELRDAMRGVERLAIVGGKLLRCIGQHPQIREQGPQPQADDQQNGRVEKHRQQAREPSFGGRHRMGPGAIAPSSAAERHR